MLPPTGNGWFYIRQHDLELRIVSLLLVTLVHGRFPTRTFSKTFSQCFAFFHHEVSCLVEFYLDDTPENVRGVGLKSLLQLCKYVLLN